MAVMADDSTHFENEDWAVMDSGLEHKRTGYFIERDEIASRRSDGLWSWPLHMAEKSWCGMPAFTEAFTCAAGLYGVQGDADLARSFKMARCEIAVPAASRTEKKMRESMPELDPQWLRALQENAGIPISRKPARAGQFASDSSRLGSMTPDRFQYREPGQGYALPMTARGRSSRPDLGRTAPWRASRRIKRAGTQIVRLLWAAWATR
jgi:hypothetical protein